MRKISTHYGMCAILLITALYGSLSMISQPAETIPGFAVMTPKAATSSEEKQQTAPLNADFIKGPHIKNSYPLAEATGSRQKAKAAGELGFFTYSATIPHYINTL